MAIGAIVTATIAKILPKIITVASAIGRGALKIGGVAARGAVATGRVAVKVGRAVVDISRAAYEIAKPLANLMKKHPYLANLLTGYTIGSNMDDIIDAVRHYQLTHGASQTDADAAALEVEGALRNMNTQIDLAEKSGINLDDEFERMATLTTSKPLKAANALTNHNTWYFKGAKVSGWSQRDYGLNIADVLEHTIVRNLYMNMGMYPGATVLQDKDVVLQQSFMSEPVKRAYYNAYCDYYARLNLAPPSSMQKVCMDLEHMLQLSVYAVASGFEMKRYYDAQETYIVNGRVGKELIGLDPISSFRFNSPLNRQAGLCWIDANTGASVEYKIQQMIPTSVTSASVNLNNMRKAAFPAMSNKVWSDMIARLSGVVMSSATYDWIKYHFDCIRQDHTKEDIHEIYVLHAPVINMATYDPETIVNSTAPLVPAIITTDGQVDQLPSSWKEQLEKCMDGVNKILRSDKAYTSMLAMLGLLNEATPSLPTMNGNKPDERRIWNTIAADMKRDVMSQTINMISADESFYRALANASYYTVYSGTTSPNERGTLWYTAPSYDTVAIGNKPELRLGWNQQKVLPSPSSRDAGDIASAVKWRWFVNMRLGPTAFWNAEAGDWYYTSPTNYQLATILPEGVKNFTINQDASINVFNLILGDSADTAAKKALMPIISAGALPADLKYVHELYPIAHRCVISPLNGYDQYKVIAMEEVLATMYPNMMLGIQQLDDMIQALSKMSVYYALQG